MESTHRFFIRLVLLCMVAFVLLAPMSAQTHSVLHREVRAIWIDSSSLRNWSTLDLTLNKLYRGNFNTVFVLVPPVNNNGQYPGIDPSLFSGFITLAKQQGLAVHAWLQSARRQYPQISDFTNPTEQEAQRQWCLDVMTSYPVLDGIHFDYIRSMSWSAPAAAYIAGVKKTIELCADAVHTTFPGKFLTATTFPVASVGYQGWRSGPPRNQFVYSGDAPEWYRNWYSTNIDNYYVSAANSSPQSFNWLLGPGCFNRQQDSVDWLATKAVDAVLPMQYSHLRSDWQPEFDLWSSFTEFTGGDFKAVIMGLGWLVEAGVPQAAFDQKAIVEAINYGRSLGASGFSIYSLNLPGSNDDALINALVLDGPDNGFNAPFKKRATSWLQTSRRNKLERW